MQQNFDDKIRLQVLGLSYSQMQSGVFALILGQVGGQYRIPIVIGAAEAQMIAIELEGVTPPRPMTHDLFETFTHAFGIRLSQVFIYKFEDGIFASEMTFTDGSRTIKVDARTSDAIAIAMRTKSPIYTTPELLAETGFIFNEQDDEQDSNDDTIGFNRDENSVSNLSDDINSEPRLENYTIEQLEQTLTKLIDDEQYEEAARVQHILDRKRNRDTNQFNDD